MPDATAHDLQSTLRELLELAIDAAGDPDDDTGLADLLTGYRRVGTFAEEGMLTEDAGLVLHARDGSRLLLRLQRA